MLCSLDEKGKLQLLGKKDFMLLVRTNDDHKRKSIFKKAIQVTGIFQKQVVH